MSTYLVTGAGGFIGSNMVRALLDRGENVVGLDDFSTGRRSNLEGIAESFNFIEGSILDDTVLARAMQGVDYVLHFAAIPSVPRSVSAPIPTCRANIEGSMRVFVAARDAGARRVVAASSSSVLGNRQDGHAHEDLPLNPISPYAVTKASMEQYAKVCTELYDIDIVCLRYFNVFGSNQDPDSSYAAVIPLFIKKLLAGEPPVIHGDGGQSRDFTYVQNVIEANLCACAATESVAGVYNIACGDTTTITELAQSLMEIIGTDQEPEYTDARPGDIRFSRADITKARDVLGYRPQISLREGLERVAAWYRDRVA